MIFYHHHDNDLPFEDGFEDVTSYQIVGNITNSLNIQSARDIFNVIDTCGNNLWNCTPEFKEEATFWNSAQNASTFLYNLYIDFFDISSEDITTYLQSISLSLFDQIISFALSISNLLFYVLVYFFCLYYLMVMDEDIIYHVVNVIPMRKEQSKVGQVK